MVKRSIFGVLMLLLISSAYAQLYADVTFDVKDNGDVHITGDTNFNEFKGTTSKFTSKENELWLLNITSPIFKEYVYEIRLPKNSVINFIKSNSQVRIEEKSGRISIIGTGSNKILSAVVQYSIIKEDNTSQIIIWTVILIAVLSIGYGAYVFLKKPKQEHKDGFKREIYTERQLLILDYLQENGIVTQAKLEKDLNLPKSSLSRNIQTLVQKGIIFKETKGMSNVIGLKD